MHVEGLRAALLDQLAGYAVRYYEDFVRPKKKFRLPDEVEAGALRALSEALAKAPAGARAEDLQTLLYDIGRTIPRYQDFQRSYLTVAIGCTGGMHRSVYVAEAVANKLAAKHVNIRTHHNEIR